MRKKWGFIFCLLFCVFPVAGCGDDSTTSYTLEEAIDAYSAALCDYQDRCVVGGGASFIDICLQSAKAEVENSTLETAPKLIEMGKLGFDGEHVGACVAALRNGSCDASLGSLVADSACSASFMGLVMEGGDCFGDDQCLMGHYCSKTTDCAGTCKSLAAANEDCTSTPCGRGLYCDDASVKCVAAKSLGAACDENKECGDSLCGPENKCVGTSSYFSEAAGAECAPGDAKYCVVGYSCALGSDEKFTCQGPIASGATCTRAGAACPIGEFCKIADGVDGMCTAKGQADAECSDDAECDWNYYCGQEQKCVQIQANGVACEQDVDCFSSVCGDEGKCIASRCL